MPRDVQSRLAAKIDVLKALRTSEADFGNHLRDLLTGKPYGVRLSARQIQVDTANLPDSRRRPDLAIFATENGQPLCTVDHMVGVIELKRSNVLTTSLNSVFAEKRDYIQPATRYFYLIDQSDVWRYDILEEADAKTWTWEELKDPASFLAAFGVISASELRLEEQLARFQQGRTRFAHLSIELYKKPAFIRTISEVSRSLQGAIEQLIDDKVVQDLLTANALLTTMESKWSTAVFDWHERRRPVEFARAIDPAQPLDDDEIADYEDDYDRFESEVRPYLYALEIEHNLLARYAERLALGQPSLLGARISKGKPTASGKAIANLAYETGALIMSRMLMVRFSEDHGLFTTRYISNGGIHIFSQYARHFHRRMQALLKETYRASAQLFAHLFDENLLDWALDREEEGLSNAILKSAYLLSRWDFRTAHGDILSGVYDQYLDTSRRRALGEVYTRPEVARFMLKLANVGPHETMLDPACGTGTFLVEGLVTEIARLKSLGLHRDVQALRTALQRFAGLDINDFAIVLAQIQIIWHLIEVLAGASTEEVRTAARALIPSIALAGGWSSLHPMGLAFNQLTEGVTADAAQMSLHYDGQRARGGRRAAELTVPRKFLRLARASYDVVVANPPYVRTHRQGGADYRSAYPEVATGVVDLYVYFIYRALRQWVKPGGRLAVIVPIAVMDADYASLLRKIMREHRITHIVDLEGLGRHTFRGVKRNTVIFVIERSAPRPGDEVELMSIPPAAYDEVADVIDFDQAVAERISVASLSQETFFPPRATMAPWVDTIERYEGDRAPMLSKLKTADVPVLQALANAPRLGSIIALAWTRTARNQPMRIEREVPFGEDALLWRNEMIAGVGIELGGSAAFAPTGKDYWKGQNIFPGGVEGRPIAIGKWDPLVSRPKSPKIYSYAHLFDDSRFYALRDIAQLPTACLAPPNGVFQNSAVVTQLAEDWPLDRYLLSRIPLWYSARVLRSTILQDFSCHWYKKTIPFIPIPPNRNANLNAGIAKAGDEAIETDRFLADQHRDIAQMISAGSSASLRDAMLAGAPYASGVDASAMPAVPVPLDGLREDKSALVGNDLLLSIQIPGADLRTFVRYELRRLLASDPQATVTRDELLELAIPADLAGVAEAIRNAEARDAEQEFEDALCVLDSIVGTAFGLSSEQVGYIQMEMKTDPILSKMRPMLRQRGLRVQAYAEAADDDDRYD